MESDASKVINWVNSDKGKSWKLRFYFNEIKYLASIVQVEFCHFIRLMVW